MTTTPWVKSSYSGGNNGACVEVRRNDTMIEVRDTKEAGAGPLLRFTNTEWAAFLTGAKHDEFDHLL